MCGIFALLNSDGLNENEINDAFYKGQGRGPESSKLDYSYIKMALGFHRLAINGLNDLSNQPIVINDIVLICNGEIYNYKQLYKTMNVTPETDSDCEVIIHLYLNYGIEQTLTMLDGVYAFVLYDNRFSETFTNNVYIARDPFGVRPLYQLSSENHKFKLVGFASELKMIESFYNKDPHNYTITQFIPGSYSALHLPNKVLSSWSFIHRNTKHFVPTFSYSRLLDSQTDIINEATIGISYYLNAAINKRCLTTERPIACLLSGGLDSSLITALVNNHLKQNKKDSILETYSIGLEGSEDLKYAKIVATYLGTKHTEIIVTEEQMFKAIPEVIYAIESYDTTTVRASIGNYLLGKYISKHSNAKVIFNGDGSDELFGGYLYMNKCPDDIEFDRETRRLLKDIHLFDVLRSDKSISSHGLEPRTPFLDRNFVNFVLSIPPFFRNHNNSLNCEKYLLRNCFTIENFQNFEGKQLLPNSILFRKKEAFSDGVSSHGRSLYIILQEYISNHLNKKEMTTKYNSTIDSEKYYYKKLFDAYYSNCENILPYFWMPKYTNATDPSARTLQNY